MRPTTAQPPSPVRVMVPRRIGASADPSLNSRDDPQLAWGGRRQVANTVNRSDVATIWVTENIDTSDIERFKCPLVIDRSDRLRDESDSRDRCGSSCQPLEQCASGQHDGNPTTAPSRPMPARTEPKANGETRVIATNRGRL